MRFTINTTKWRYTAKEIKEHNLRKLGFVLTPPKLDQDGKRYYRIDNRALPIVNITTFKELMDFINQAKPYPVIIDRTKLIIYNDNEWDK